MKMTFGREMLTFDEWCDEMEAAGRIFMSESINTPADRTMAKQAWDAAFQEGHRLGWDGAIEDERLWQARMKRALQEIAGGKCINAQEFAQEVLDATSR